MLVEQTLLGVRNKVAIAIDRLQAFEPSEGYYLAFSGGKDSQCIYHLALEAGVKFDTHYNLTTVDPPELVQFIKKNYPDVKIERPRETMWQLIPRKLMPPTRLARYCCDVLKEGSGEGRIVLTGVRWAESSARRNRDVIEIVAKTKAQKIKLNSDNHEDRKLFETCIQKGKRVVNAIVDWEDADVWEYLNSRNIEHCCLYDQGYKRLGCIGCPMSSKAARELGAYPIYKRAYIRAFDKMISVRKQRGLDTQWETGEEVMEWWLYGTVKQKQCNGQMEIEDMVEGEE